jgi:hypothetical protein
MKKFFTVLLCTLALAGATLSAQLPTVLLQKQHLVYEGAFRLPATGGFDGGGQAMSFNPVTNSLMFRNGAEVNIPAVLQGNFGDLATATLRSPARALVDESVFVCNEQKLVGGTLPWLGDLIVSVYCYFDGGTEQRSHWRLSGSTVMGPVRVGSIGAGFVAGWMTPIPQEWQAEFGGPALTGQGSIPVISRTSAGPAASVFNPADIGVKNPVPATPVLGYPMDHQTIGTTESNGTLYNTTQWMGGMVFPNGTSTVLFFAGRKAKGQFCYGPGTDDQSLHMTPYPGAPQSENWCYDPVNHDKGTHGYPYAHFVYAYDAKDLVAVKNGQKAMWQVVPYATWEFDLPFQYAQRVLPGVAYDPLTKRIYMTAANADVYKPIVHVFRVDPAVAVPPPTQPPPPPPVTTAVGSVTATAPSPVVTGTSVQIVTVVKDTAGNVISKPVTCAVEHSFLGSVDSNCVFTAASLASLPAGWTKQATGFWATSEGVSSPWGFILVVAPTTQPPPPADTDGDGVPDSSDSCPTVAGTQPDGCQPPPPPPPAPVDPCVALPGLLTVSQWPLAAEGSRRFTYSYTVAGTITEVVSGSFTLKPDTFTVVDKRGCTASAKRP